MGSSFFVEDGYDPIEVVVTPPQPLDDDLTQIAALTSEGYLKRIAGVWSLDPSVSGGGGGGTWGSITGTLSDQTDLWAALSGKADTSHTHTLSDITDAGTAAAKDVGTSGNKVPLLDGDNTWSGGNTFSGQVIIDQTADYFIQDAAAGVSKYTRFTSGLLPRWDAGATSQTESGADAGTNYRIRSFDDSGTYKEDVAEINRATGLTWLKGLSLATALAIADGGHGGTTAADARTNLGVEIGSDVQAWDADLDAIAALAGTSGLLKKTAADTWTLDTSTYLTSLGIGSLTQAWDADLDAIAALSGTSGFLKKTAANTWSLDTNTYLTTASAASTYQPLDGDLTAIAAISGTSGLLKKTAANTWSLDTNTYLTTSSAASTYQPLDADLTAIAALTSAADKMPYSTGAGTWALTALTSAGRALIDDADASAQRTTLGVGTGDSPQFTAVNVGHATDTTLSRLAAGTLGVEGKAIPYVSKQSAVLSTAGAVTTEVTLATITIPGGAVGPNGSVRITCGWQFSSSANNKRCSIYLVNTAGTPLHESTHTTAKNFTTTKMLFNVNSQSAQRASSPTYWYGPPQESSDDYFTSTVDTSANWDIVIAGKKSNSGDTLSLAFYLIEIFYGA